MSTRTLALTGFALGLLMSLGACSGDTGKPDTGPSTDDSNPGDSDSSVTPFEDNDDDGIPASDGDCNDDDPTVFPGATEECNGVDDNCNGVTDEGYTDVDADGTADCEDSEDCDGEDNDGDGVADEDFADTDGDGVADCVGTEACDGIDNNGDGQIDEGYDADGDGYSQCGTEAGGGTSDDLVDCDDTDAAINPGASEASGDHVDNNCDGVIDDNAWAVGDLIITEVMNNPGSVSDTFGEWFEVVNASERDLILNGLWILSSSGSESHQISPDDDELLTLAAGEYLVLGIEGDVSQNGSVPVSYEYDGITLGNESDTLSLVLGGTVIDAVSWDGGSSYPDPDGASLTLDPTATDEVLNDNSGSWCEATEDWGSSTDLGSPGGNNEYCTTFDHDGDGYSVADDDCDDWDDAIYPGAPELDPTVDNDCDGAVEWMPTAAASYDTGRSNLYTCDELYLDGSGSYDPDGSVASYSWELTSAPSGSDTTTADIINTTDQKPYFIPDVEGDYTFSLTVNDGGTDSYPDSVSVAIATRPTNTTPAANAGTDQSYNATQECQAISYGVFYECEACSDYTFTLNARGSSDGDGDALSYSWTVVSATDGATYALEDETTATPTLTVSDTETSYGEATTVTFVLEVTVTDCMGATHTDQVTITYTCTGT